MKLLVANHTGNKVGGAEQYLHAILPALVGSGWETRLLTEDRGPRVAGVERWFGDKAGARHEIQAWAPDVAFVHGLLDSSLERWLVETFPAVHFAHNYYGTCISGEKRHIRPGLQTCERRFGPACLPIYGLRGCGPFRPGAVARGYLLQRRRNALLSAYRSIVVASEHMRREFQRHVSRPVVLAPYFVAPATMEAVRRDPTRFAFVGRMTALKGADIAIQAIHLLRRQQRVEAELDLIGDGPERAGWERKAAQLGVAARFHGWLGPESRDQVLKLACALVVPSLWPEPFGLVGLEAARLAVPSVAFRMGGIPDWLSDGETGALCDPFGDLAANLAAGMMRARVDLATANAWGAGALRNISRFGQEEHLKILMTLFAEVERSAHASSD